MKQDDKTRVDPAAELVTESVVSSSLAPRVSVSAFLLTKDRRICLPHMRQSTQAAQSKS